MPFKGWIEINELVINDNQFLYPDCETVSPTSGPFAMTEGYKRGFSLILISLETLKRE